jgi:hypothetical protein
MKTILFTNARDEKNIKEWASHHLLIGFDIIIIFDHKSRFPIHNILQNFDNRIKVIECRINGPIKIKCMKYAVNLAKKHNANWMLYLDADEFLCLNKWKGVKQMLSFFPDYDSIAINWLMFGSNHFINDPSGLLLENYIKSDKILNKHVKSFVRPNKVKNINNPHYFIIHNSFKMGNVFHKRMIGPDFCFNEYNIPYWYAPAYIAHYVYQSEETYINRKVILPSDDTNTLREKNNNIHKHHNAVINETLKNNYAENVRLFLNK